jgi:tetratricopeptide (TPR) repeat protein
MTAQAPAASSVEALADISKRIDDLARRVYSDAVKAETEAVLAELPSPDQAGLDAARKARVLTLRARARLILPAYSKEAEADLSKALKLRPGDTAAWVAMSECLWKRDALKEARDALDSALSVDPKCVPALAQLSRILRAFCSRKEIPSEERVQLMELSVAKAKEAVAIDMTSGEAWAALGIALMQQTVALGMDLGLLRKALQALTQAGRRNEQDPDIAYNRGVVRKCLGEYGAACSDFAKAYELDPAGLSTALKEKQSVAALLAGFQGVIAAFTTTTTAPAAAGTSTDAAPGAATTAAAAAGSSSDTKQQRDFKKNVLSKLPLVDAANPNREFVPLRAILAKSAGAAASDNQQATWAALRVIELVSSPSDQPLCYMAVDREGTFCALLVYRVLPAAMSAGDVAFVPFPPTGIARHEHKYTTAPTDARAVSAVERTLDLISVTAEPTALFVNGAPIAKSNFKMPLLATRQFV